MPSEPTITTTIELPLDDQSWTDEWDKAINPIEATAYGHLSTPRGLTLQMYHEGNAAEGNGYGGWLCKNVCRLPLETETIAFQYRVVIDEATLLSAQVIETDMKATDSRQRTYDGSLQFNIAKGWLVEIGDPWQSTGIHVPPPEPNRPMKVLVLYGLDYQVEKPTIRFESIRVDGIDYAIGATFDAQEVGWDKSQIVTQLQQCNRSVPGGYTLTFPMVGYLLR